MCRRLAVLPILPMICGDQTGSTVLASVKQGDGHVSVPGHTTVLFSELPKTSVLKASTPSKTLQGRTPAPSDAVSAALLKCNLTLPELFRAAGSQAVLVEPAFVTELSTLVMAPFPPSTMARTGKGDLRPMAPAYGGGPGAASQMVSSFLRGLGALPLTPSNAMQELVLPALRSFKSSIASTPASPGGPSVSDGTPAGDPSDGGHAAGGIHREVASLNDQRLILGLLGFPLASGLIKPQPLKPQPAPNSVRPNLVPFQARFHDLPMAPTSIPALSPEEALMQQLIEAAPLLTSSGEVIKTRLPGPDMSMTRVLLHTKLGGVDFDAFAPGFLEICGVMTSHPDRPAGVEAESWTWLLRRLGCSVFLEPIPVIADDGQIQVCGWLLNCLFRLML